MPLVVCLPDLFDSIPLDGYPFATEANLRWAVTVDVDEDEAHVVAVEDKWA